MPSLGRIEFISMDGAPISYEFGALCYHVEKYLWKYAGRSYLTPEDLAQEVLIAKWLDSKNAIKFTALMAARSSMWARADYHMEDIADEIQAKHPNATITYDLDALVDFRTLLEKADPEMTRILLWKLEGYQQQEIQQFLGCGKKKVKNALTKKAATS